MSCADNFGRPIENGTRVRFVAGLPPRVRYGVVTLLDDEAGTMIAVEEGSGRNFGVASSDVQVLPPRCMDTIVLAGLAWEEPTEEQTDARLRRR